MGAGSRIDPIRRMSDVVTIVNVSGAGVWRTRAEHERSPNSFTMRTSQEPATISLTVARRHRAGLGQDTQAIAEDLTASSRERCGHDGRDREGALRVVPAAWGLAIVEGVFGSDVFGAGPRLDAQRVGRSDVVEAREPRRPVRAAASDQTKAPPRDAPLRGRSHPPRRLVTRAPPASRRHVAGCRRESQGSRRSPRV